MVAGIKGNEHQLSPQITKSQKSHAQKSRSTRTLKEQKVDTICLEDIWKERLSMQQWQDDSISQFLRAWADTTWLSYNRYFAQFQMFAAREKMKMCDIMSVDMANFLVSVARDSARPHSILMSAVSAVNSYFRAIQCQSPVNEDVFKLIESLVKSGSVQPMRRTQVMPMAPFMEMFRKWGENLSLSTWALRLKSVVLLSLSMMLRPSDIAPHSKHADLEGKWLQNHVKRSWLSFSKVGYLEMYMFGIKNDYDRKGFCVAIPEASDGVLCPVCTLKEYLKCTQHLVAQDGAVFLSLQKPYKPLSVQAVAAILRNFY